MKRTLIFSLLLFLLAPPAMADVPMFITHQGKILGNNDTPIGGVEELTFSLYEVPTEGDPVWTETLDITFTDGQYKVILGTLTTIPGDLFDTDEFYLGITLADNDEFSPRHPISSVPFALKTLNANSVTGSVNAEDGMTVGDIPVIDTDGLWVGEFPGTPSDVLDKILEADGVGSGLDADLLQGSTLEEVLETISLNQTGDLTVDGNIIATGSVTVGEGDTCNNSTKGTLRIYGGDKLQVCTGSHWGTVFPASLGSSENPASSCKEILDEGISHGNGVYDIRINGTDYRLYCDMDNGGWTYISYHPLYGTFQTCGKTGPTGPSQTQCNGSYGFNSPLFDTVELNSGIQTYVLPRTATYKIEAFGAGGAPGCYNCMNNPHDNSYREGGLGAYVAGQFDLDEGQALKVMVGQKGCKEGMPECGGTYGHQPGGGGGGTFVTLEDNTPLIVAGGGGGGGSGNYGQMPGDHASINTSGTHGGGSDGSGGTGASSYNGAGAGLTGNGAASSCTAAQSFTNGGIGGQNTSGHAVHSYGGFGGGGAGGLLPGGGGGYSGGGCSGSWSSTGKAGGGGSYNGGVAQEARAEANAEEGWVTVSFIPPQTNSEAANCKEILDAGESYGNGVYTITISGQDYRLFCDMNNGGWTYFDHSRNLATFTNCDKIGSTGPSQDDCNTAYSESPIIRQVTVNEGIQTFDMPYTATYRIEAFGGEGAGGCTSCGNNSSSGNFRAGGKGAYVAGEFDFNEGDELKFMVGHKGCKEGWPECGGSYTHQPGGGGGGTFIALPDNTPILVAGGGGGGGQGSYGQTVGDDAVTDTSGTHNGGSGGGGGTGASSYNGAGAGFTGNGTASSSVAAQSFTNGGVGGRNTSHATYSHGGFGGGGAGGLLPGGGGGYSGGGCSGSWSGSGHAGGGGSYNDGANQVNTDGVNTGPGKVIISFMP